MLIHVISEIYKVKMHGTLKYICWISRWIVTKNVKPEVSLTQLNDSIMQNFKRRYTFAEYCQPHHQNSCISWWNHERRKDFQRRQLAEKVWFKINCNLYLSWWFFNWYSSSGVNKFLKQVYKLLSDWMSSSPIRVCSIQIARELRENQTGRWHTGLKS